MWVAFLGLPRDRVEAADLDLAGPISQLVAQRLAGEAAQGYPRRKTKVLREDAAGQTRRLVATVRSSVSRAEQRYHGLWSTPNRQCIARHAFGVCCQWASPLGCLGRSAIQSSCASKPSVQTRIYDILGRI